jgi:hypothetical protein
MNVGWGGGEAYQSLRDLYWFSLTVSRASRAAEASSAGAASMGLAKVVVAVRPMRNWRVVRNCISGETLVVGWLVDVVTL